MSSQVVIFIIYNSNFLIKLIWTCGAMVARLTPDQKVIRSNRVRFIMFLLFTIPYGDNSFCFSLCPWDRKSSYSVGWWIPGAHALFGRFPIGGDCCPYNQETQPN
jgi:hypothetical protein